LFLKRVSLFLNQLLSSSLTVYNTKNVFNWLPWQEVDSSAVVDLPEYVVKVLAVSPEAVNVVVEAGDAAEVSVEDVSAGLEKISIYLSVCLF